MIDNSHPVTVRGMTTDDVPAVMVIDRLSLRTPWSERSFQYELTENPASCLLIAEHEADVPQIVGFIGFWMLIDEAHVSTIAVHPDCRRQGIGGMLVREAIRQAIERGAELATLEVRQSNRAAISLYQKHDFEFVGRRVRYYRDNQEDAILMTRRDLREKVPCGRRR